MDGSFAGRLRRLYDNIWTHWHVWIMLRERVGWRIEKDVLSKKGKEEVRC